MLSELLYIITRSVNDIAKVSNFRAIAKSNAKLFHIHYDNL